MVGKVNQLVKSPLLATYINYESFGNIVQSAAGTLAALAPGKPGLDFKQYESFKHLGKISFTCAYKPGVLRVEYGQEFPPL